jgi:hypothetical protein
MYTVAQVEQFVTQQIAERAELQKQKAEAVAEAVVRAPLCLEWGAMLLLWGYQSALYVPVGTVVLY